MTRLKIAVVILFIILVTHTLIIKSLIYFPYPELFLYPYLTNNGLTPYKDIFDQHFPGLMFLPINLDNLGMNTPEMARVWSIAVVLIIHLLIFFITYKILKDPLKALIANLFFLTWQPFLEGWVLWIDSFLPLFLLPAFYFLYKYINKTKNSYLFWLGIFLGLAVVFKQVIIPLAGMIFIYLLIFGKKVKPLLYFLAGFLPLPLLMIGYFYFLGALKDFWFWTVWFNLTTFAKYGRKGATFSGLIRILFIFSPLLLTKYLDNKRLIMILLIFIFGSLASASSRFDFVHFQPSLPFVAITAALILAKLFDQTIFKIALMGFFIISVVFLTNFYRGHISSNVLFFDRQTYQMSDRIKSLTDEKEEIFIFGASPHLYQMSKTLPASKIFVFQFPWFIMESEERLVDSLKRSDPNLVLRDSSVEIEGWKITDYAKKIDLYILENYTEVDRIGNVQFLIKKDKYANRI